jgi:triphosphatase
MFETELKFQIPQQARVAVAKAVATPAARRTRLQAVYADTADQRLAAAGFALRLRKEGRRWVQTLKGPKTGSKAAPKEPGADGPDALMQRFEHEVPRPGAAQPALDARLHAGTPLGDRLLALLADQAPLVPVYRTDVLRVHRQVRHLGAVIELAHDHGRIIAGEHEAPVDEVEFELLRGEPAALVDLAARWVQRHGLWWDVRTKAERGWRLAMGREQVPATKAAATQLAPDLVAPAALAQLVADSLAQALPNAAEIASETSAPEHLHQLRVALRRLRTVLCVFGAWAPEPEAAAALEQAWREPFGELGANRDADVFAQTLLPALQAAGAPELPAPPRVKSAPPADVVRSPVFQGLLLQTLRMSLLQPPAPAADAAAWPSLAQAAPAALAPVLKRVRRDAERFAAASAEQRHDLRKRAKRLRYALEGVLPLAKRKRAEQLLRQLRAVLETLGELNDLETAADQLRLRTAAEPAAWFALGYVAAKKVTLEPLALRRLARLRRQRLDWKKN